MSETPFVETEIIVALLDGSVESFRRAQELADELLPNEKRALSLACRQAICCLSDLPGQRLPAATSGDDGG